MTKRQASRAGTCARCRHPPRIQVTDRYRNWWLHRYTMPEIIQMGAPFVTDDMPALLASARRDD